MDNQLKQILNKRLEVNALRQLPRQHNLVDFSSNDYLGLAKEKLSLSACNNGSGGSRLISGNSTMAERLESALADFYGTESALLFNSGYDANLGLFSCLLQKGDTYIYDQLVHASIRDGMRLSHANSYAFKHNDLAALEVKLKQAKGKLVVVIESVYSMDGDVAPIKDVVALCEAYNASLIVDEAHSTGIFGSSGKGLTDHYELGEKVYARIHTFGKAIGAHGAVVVGSETLTDYLINFARSFIYTTALPEHALETIAVLHDRLKGADEQRKKVKQNIITFQSGLSPKVTKNLIESCSPIQCVLFSGNEEVKALAEHLQVAGYDVRPIMSPTVEKGKERIRICIHAFNTVSEIKGLTETMNKYVKDEG